MDHIQTDVSDRGLVNAVRANMGDFLRHLGVSYPDGHFENEKFTRWRVPIPHPWFNGVLSSALPDESDTAFIEETIQYFRAQKVRTFTWWLEAHLKSPDWGPMLGRHGFGLSKDTPGMAVELKDLPAPIHAADGLEVRQVFDEELARL